MSVIEKIHNLSLHVLTLCGLGAVICLAVNILSALIMFIADRQKDAQAPDCN